MAHNNKRSPEFKGDVSAEVINNVIYNWGELGTHFGSGDVTDKPVFANIINNYYKAGPNSTASDAIYFHTGSWAINDSGRIYLNGNVLPNTAPGDDWNGLPEKYRSLTPAIEPSGINVQPAEEAYGLTLSEAGASYGLNCDGSTFNRRDSVDVRIINEVQQGSGRIIDSPSDVGGWPTINPGTPCPDTDHDGMADDWELNHFGSLDRGSANDSSGDYDGDGYTDLEEFLNGTDPTNGTPTPTPTPTPPTHCSPLGDIDCSGKVNGIDFGYLVTYWDTSNPQANLDDTGVVDAADALILFGNYGKGSL